MAQSIQESYESVAYPSNVQPQMHPDRLSVLAKLYSMNPVPIESCRVLELGCGDGSSLISFANTLPNATFKGVDIAVNHIESGNRLIADIGLKNIKLEQADVTKLEKSFGEFDFIIAHGFISWIPDFVREKVFEICSQNLSENGVAYISYNTYPGFYHRQIVRDIMRYHVREIETPYERTKQSADFLKFLTTASNKAETYNLTLKHELENITDKPIEILLHDDIAEINQAFYFHEFVSLAEKNNLQFLSEADFTQSQDYIYPENVHAFLSHLKNESIVEFEQYIDFIKGRRFRQSLICHKDIQLKRNANAESIQEFFIASSAKFQSGKPDLKGRKPEKFSSQNKASATMDNPLVKAALFHLSQSYPRYVHFDDLLEKARDFSATKTETDAKDLSNYLLEIYRSGLLELHIFQPPFTTKVSDKPKVSELVRHQLKSTQFITTQRCITINISDEFSRKLLQLLDGTRDKQALIRDLTVWINSTNGKDIEKRKFIEQLPNKVRIGLEQIANLALLVE